MGDTQNMLSPVARRKKEITAGRRYQTVKELIAACEGYFVHADKVKDYYSIPGLALFLGFCSRHTVFDYLSKDDELAPIMRQAVLRIEHQRIQQLLKDKNTAGKIFDLVNNFHYKNEYRNKIGGDGSGIGVSVMAILDGKEIEGTGKPSISEDEDILDI